MLSKKEKAVMSVIYEKANNKMGTCLIRPIDLLASIPYTYEITKNDMESIISDLILDDYFELVETEKRNDCYYCITLGKKGFGFARSELLDKRDRRRAIFFKILLCCAGAIATIIVQQILKNILAK